MNDLTKQVELQEVADRQHLSLIVLFGSQAAQTAHAVSDTDVGVLADHSLSLSERSKIGEEIALALAISEDHLDLIDLSSASPLLQFEVARKGRLLAGAETDFTLFKLRAWRYYQDTARFRRARERVLAERYAK